MKKILFFICTLDDGGAQRVVSILSNKLVERGFGVEILKYYEGCNIYPLSEKVKVNSVEENTRSRNVLTNLRWMRKYFKDNCDVIISFLASYNILALLANRGRKPIIVADRNDPNIVPSNKLVRYIRNHIYKKANCVVLQTKQNKEYFDKYINDKGIVIANPIYLEKMAGRALITDKEKLIVTAGRLAPQKNHLMLINAFSKISNEFKDYKLVIYGDDDSCKIELLNRIKTLGLEDRVILPGRSLNLLNDICKAELFVLSSNYEGMPNAIIEAMCVGLPVISTKVSGSTDLIKDGENGYLIDINNEDQLIDKMKMLLSNKDLSNKIATNAMQLGKIVDDNVVTNQWEEIIEKL